MHEIRGPSAVAPGGGVAAQLPGTLRAYQTTPGTLVPDPPALPAAASHDDESASLANGAGWSLVEPLDYDETDQTLWYADAPRLPDGVVVPAHYWTRPLARDVGTVLTGLVFARANERPEPPANHDASATPAASGVARLPPWDFAVGVDDVRDGDDRDADDPGEYALGRRDDGGEFRTITDWTEATTLATILSWSLADRDDADRRDAHDRIVPGMYVVLWFGDHRWIRWDVETVRLSANGRRSVESVRVRDWDGSGGAGPIADGDAELRFGGP